MSFSVPQPLRCGPFTVYLQAIEGCADLKKIAQNLQSQQPVIWFDSARQHPQTGRWSILGSHPWLTFIARGETAEYRTTAATRRLRLSPLEALREVLKRYELPPLGAAHSRMLGLMGYLSYEVNRWIERLPPPKPGNNIPEMVWYGMKRVWLVDHQEKQTWLLSLVDPHAPLPAAASAAGEALEAMGQLMQSQLPQPSPAISAAGTAPNIQPTTTQAEFENSVNQALGYIRSGEIFQANLSQRFTARWDAPAWPLYENLRAINPSPFACWFSCEELTVVSSSPERLVRVQEGWVDTRPIAGTRPRGVSADEDELKRLELLLSEKERAEHIMLVDLARNDLGRVCRPGSVSVNELMSLEAYSHVNHIVSDVIGRLQKSADSVDVIQAVFPGGTITGCPKVRCMEIVHQLEPVARGLYTGSLGLIGFDGTLDLNIAIRTMVIANNQLSFHVGAGIVADSKPAREYEETLAKAAALMAAIEKTQESPEDCHARC